VVTVKAKRDRLHVLEPGPPQQQRESTLASLTAPAPAAHMFRERFMLGGSSLFLVGLLVVVPDKVGRQPYVP
jgi:hypothetical protein